MFLVERRVVSPLNGRCGAGAARSIGKGPDDSADHSPLKAPQGHAPPRGHAISSDASLETRARCFPGNRPRGDRVRGGVRRGALLLEVRVPAVALLPLEERHFHGLV